MNDINHSDQLSAGIRPLAAELIAGAANISIEREKALNGLAEITARHLRESNNAALTFICTHNSRRSHLSQVTAQMAAVYYGLKGVRCYSGGTEATACNPRTVAAFRQAGFEVEQTDESENPIYTIGVSASGIPLRAWSKVYNEDGNPTTNYIAVMTCTHADENCPIAHGAADRVSLPFTDPKESDDTPEEAATYDLRLQEIGAQMFHLMSKVRRLS